MINWPQVLTIFLATTPLLAVVLSLLGVMIWNLMDIRALRNEMNTNFAQIRAELVLIRSDIASIRERVAKLEERDQHPHLVQP